MSCIADLNIKCSGSEICEVARSLPWCASVYAVTIASIASCRSWNCYCSIAGAETGYISFCNCGRENRRLGNNEPRVQDYNTGRVGCIPDPNVVGSRRQVGEIAQTTPGCASVCRVFISPVTSCNTCNCNYTIACAVAADHCRCYSGCENSRLSYYKCRIQDNNACSMCRISYSYVIWCGCKVNIYTGNLPWSPAVYTVFVSSISSGRRWNCYCPIGGAVAGDISLCNTGAQSGRFSNIQGTVQSNNTTCICGIPDFNIIETRYKSWENRGSLPWGSSVDSIFIGTISACCSVDCYCAVGSSVAGYICLSHGSA